MFLAGLLTFAFFAPSHLFKKDNGFLQKIPSIFTEARFTVAGTVSDFHRIPILIPTNIGNQKHCKCTFKPEIVKIFGLYISKKIENPKVFYLDFIKKKHQMRTEVNL